MAYAPDKNIPYHGPKEGESGKKGGNRASFAPGLVNRYVQEQVSINGGDPAKWRAHFKSIYSPQQQPDYSWEKRGGGGNGNNGGGKDPTGNGPGTNPNPPDTGFDPSRPDHKTAPMQMPMPMQAQGQGQGQGMPMGGFLNVGPMGQRLPPTMGLLGAPPQMQQQRPQAQGGMLPPEIQALLQRR